MTFLVQVTHPGNATDQHDERFECESVDELATRLDDVTDCGLWTALEQAAWIAVGDDYCVEDLETGRVVTARRVEVHKPTEIAELGYKRQVCASCGTDWPCSDSVKSACEQRRADGQEWCDCGWHESPALAGGRS